MIFNLLMSLHANRGFQIKTPFNPIHPLFSKSDIIYHTTCMSSPRSLHRGIKLMLIDQCTWPDEDKTKWYARFVLSLGSFNSSPPVHFWTKSRNTIEKKFQCNLFPCNTRLKGTVRRLTRFSFSLWFAQICIHCSGSVLEVSAVTARSESSLSSDTCSAKEMWRWIGLCRMGRLHWTWHFKIDKENTYTAFEFKWLSMEKFTKAPLLCSIWMFME